MADEVSTVDVRQRIGDMLNRVALRHDEFIIEHKGKALAALIPLERLKQSSGSPVGTLWTSWGSNREVASPMIRP